MTINLNTANLTVLLLAAAFATGCEEPTEPETSPMPATEELSRQELDAEAEAQRQNAELRDGVQQEIQNLKAGGGAGTPAEQQQKRAELEDAWQKRTAEMLEADEPPEPEQK